jgi:hypothetical protein
MTDRYKIQREVCFLRGLRKCTLKEAWNLIATVEKAKKQAQNNKTGILKIEDTKQLKIDL